MKLFSPDSKIMVALGRLGDLILLNFFFLLTCVPIFTIGASITALYTVTFKFATEKEVGVLSGYFRAFRSNFKQATQLWLIILLCGVCALLDAFLFYRLQGALHFLFIPFAAMFLLVLLTAAYAFPLLSQFNNSTKQTLKNAMLFGVGFLPRSLVITALNVFPFAVLLLDLLVFMQAGFLWFFLYFSAIAYLNGLLLKKVFKPYWNQEEDAE